MLEVSRLTPMKRNEEILVEPTALFDHKYTNKLNVK